MLDAFVIAGCLSGGHGSTRSSSRRFGSVPTGRPVGDPAGFRLETIVLQNPFADLLVRGAVPQHELFYVTPVEAVPSQ
jgi:hypothetical protein